jgi:ATP-dependent protease HslVU (ClpYQ) peptidase subunit
MSKPTPLQLKAREIQARIEQRIANGESFLCASFPVFVLPMSKTESIAFATPFFGVGATKDQALEALKALIENDGTHAEGLPEAKIKIATRMESSDE